MSIMEAIKTHVESGKNINCFSNVEPVLFQFLDEYYEKAEEESSVELELPLVQRASGILEQLRWLLDQGAAGNVAICPPRMKY